MPSTTTYASQLPRNPALADQLQRLTHQTASGEVFTAAQMAQLQQNIGKLSDGERAALNRAIDIFETVASTPAQRENVAKISEVLKTTLATRREDLEHATPIADKIGAAGAIALIGIIPLSVVLGLLGEIFGVPNSQAMMMSLYGASYAFGVPAALGSNYVHSRAAAAYGVDD